MAMPGGGCLIDGDGDFAEHGFEIGENVFVGEPDHDVALAAEVVVPLTVTRGLLRRSMALSIHLDDEPPLPATEIRDERSMGHCRMNFSP